MSSPGMSRSVRTCAWRQPRPALGESVSALARRAGWLWLSWVAAPQAQSANMDEGYATANFEMKPGQCVLIAAELIGANPVAVCVVAAAAVRSSANSGCARRCRTDAVAPIPVAAITASIACAAHCDSAAPSWSSNRDRAATVAAPTSVSATAAAPSLGIIGDQAGDEQNESRDSSENVSEHDGNPFMHSLSPLGRLRREPRGRLI
jgi:hypothetical protein